MKEKYEFSHLNYTNLHTLNTFHRDYAHLFERYNAISREHGGDLGIFLRAIMSEREEIITTTTQQKAEWRNAEFQTALAGELGKRIQGLMQTAEGLAAFSSSFSNYENSSVPTFDATNLALKMVALFCAEPDASSSEYAELESYIEFASKLGITMQMEYPLFLMYIEHAGDVLVDERMHFGDKLPGMEIMFQVFNGG